MVWVPTDILKANNVSAWSGMPVWIPGQGRTFGFHRRDLSRAVAEGLTYRPLPLGHIDLLVGRDAPWMTWKLVTDWLGQRVAS